MENEMKKILQYKKGKISIGATHNIGEPVLPKIMVEFSQHNPEIEFDLYIKNRESLVKHLKENGYKEDACTRQIEAQSAALYEKLKALGWEDMSEELHDKLEKGNEEGMKMQEATTQ